MINREDLAPIPELLRLVDDADAIFHVVTVEGLIEPATGAIEWVGNLLDLDEDLSDNFRRALRGSLRILGEAVPDTYEPGWMPTAGEIAIATRDVLEDSPLLSAILESIQHRRRAADIPFNEDGEVGDEPPRSIRAYAVVVSMGQETAIFVRGRNPVEEYRRGRLTAVWSRRRLTRARRLLAFDGGIDVAILGDRVVIRSVAALERLFIPPEVRIAGAEAAVTDLNERVPIANLDDLLDVARRDSIFGAKLRLLAKSGLLADVTTERLRRSLERTGLAARFIVQDELIFPTDRAWRWRFIQALEDSFVSSAGTGYLYTTGSKRRWLRRQVTGAVRDNGSIVELCGPDWGPIPVTQVASELLDARGEYFVEDRGQVFEILATSRQAVEVANVQGDPLARLGLCSEG
jgi:hypothetical protein